MARHRKRLREFSEPIRKSDKQSRTRSYFLILLTILILSFVSAGFIFNQNQLPQIRTDALIYPAYEGKQVTLIGYMATVPRLTVLEQIPIYFPKLLQEPYANHNPPYNWQIQIAPYPNLGGWPVIIFLTQTHTTMLRNALQVGAIIQITGTVYYTPLGILREQRPYMIVEAIQIL